MRLSSSTALLLGTALLGAVSAAPAAPAAADPAAHRAGFTGRRK
jgi:hypothetical protein